MKRIFMVKTCVSCGLKGGTKKWKFVHHTYQKSYLCGPCIESLGGARKALEWLESQNFDFAYNILKTKINHSKPNTNLV